MNLQDQIFNNNTPYTIGVEEEYMLCDPSNGNLLNKAEEIMDKIPDIHKDRYSYELILSEIEINTSPCETVRDAMNEISAGLLTGDIKP